MGTDVLKLDRECGQTRGTVSAGGCKPTKFLIIISFLALALRLSVMLLSSSYQVVDYGDDHFSFGWEMEESLDHWRRGMDSRLLCRCQPDRLQS